jgi:hypothetical protein
MQSEAVPLLSSRYYRQGSNAVRRVSHEEKKAYASSWPGSLLLKISREMTNKGN